MVGCMQPNVAVRKEFKPILSRYQKYQHVHGSTKQAAAPPIPQYFTVAKLVSPRPHMQPEAVSRENLSNIMFNLLDYKKRGTLIVNFGVRSGAKE